MTPQELQNRALLLSKDRNRIVFFNPVYCVFINIPIWGQTTFIGGDSGTGKTFLINKISYLLELQESEEIKLSTICSPDFYNIKVAINESNLSSEYKKSDLLIADRVDYYTDKGIDILNKHIQDRGTQILFSRTTGRVNLTHHPARLEMNLYLVDGILCYEAKEKRGFI